MTARRSPSARIGRRLYRRGNFLVLTALIMVAMGAILAFAVDLGYLYAVRTELQAAADAAALAAAGAMYEAPNALEADVLYHPPDPLEVRTVARDYVRKNGAGAYRVRTTRLNGDYGVDGSNAGLQVDWNYSNDPEGDIVIGQIHNPSNLSSPLIPTTSTPNSVLVRIPMQQSHVNGSVSLFFAPIIGINKADVYARATAAVEYPTLLPFATSEDKWNSLASGGDGDNYIHGHGHVDSGADGIPEIQVFPDNHWDGNGMPPGNFGALEIGGVEGTDILRRQIDMGPTESEIAYHGSAFESGMVIPGKTGVNGDIKTAFTGGNADLREYAGILGKSRYIPLYSHVTGNGSNSQFTISKFVAVRVMAAKMTGGSKYIVLQPVTSVKNLLNLHLVR